jgi:predicted nucleic acid-binding protein
VILADTSAWIELDRATGSALDRRLGELLGSDELGVTEPVLMEVLQGASSEQDAERLRSLLLGCELLTFQASIDFELAAYIHRRCRAAGITPRGAVDCMIVAVARRNDATLLTGDADQLRVAATFGVRDDLA